LKLTAFFAVNIDMEKQVEELVYQLRELIPTLKGLGPSPGTGGGGTASKTASKTASSTDRLIVALGQLSARLEKGKMSRKAENKAVEEFTKSVEKSAKALDEEANAVAKREAARQKILEDQKKAADRAAMTQKERDAEDRKDREKEKKEKNDARNTELQGKITAARYGTSASKNLYDQMSHLGDPIELLKTKFLDMHGSSMSTQVGLRGMLAAVEGVTKGLATFSSAVYKGERGAAVSAKAMTAFTKPILDFVSTAGSILVTAGAIASFIPTVRVASGAVKLFGKALGPVVVKIIEYGKWIGVAVGGLLGIGATVGKTAAEYNELSAEQADRLFKSFRELSAAGVNVAGGMDGVFDTLQSLGYSASQIEDFNRLLSTSTGKLSLMAGTAGQGAKRFADVAGGLSKSDLGYQLEMLGMTVEEQRESALAYMNIQARTGQLQSKNTQQLIAESAAFAKELDLSAQLMGTSRKAQQEAQEAALAETRFRAALIDAEQRGDKEEMDRLKRAQNMAAMAKAAGDERGFRGILQGAAGGLTTQEAIAAEQTYGVQRILDQGNITDSEMARQMGENSKTMLGLTAGVSKFVGQIDTMQTSITGMDDFSRRIGAISEAAAKQNLSINDFLKTEQGQRMAQGGDTKAMTTAGRDQQAAAMLQDSVVKTYNAAATINKVASETFRDAVSVFSRTMRADPVPGGTPGYPTGTSSSAVTTPGGTSGAVVIPPVTGAAPAAETPWYSKISELFSGPTRGNFPAAAKVSTAEQQLLDLIGQGESQGNYNALVYGKQGMSTPKSADLTNMTIAQVQEYQRGMIGRGHASTAVGKYQMIEGTLAEQVKKAGLDPTTTKFDQKTQDLLARQLIQQAGYGKKDTATVMNNLAGTWASLPKDMTGVGRYDGYNSNRAIINPQDLVALLSKPGPTATVATSKPTDTAKPTATVVTSKPTDTAKPTATVATSKPTDTAKPTATVATSKPTDTAKPTDVSPQVALLNQIQKEQAEFFVSRNQTAAAPASGYQAQTPTASAVITPAEQTPAQAVAADQSAQLAQRIAMLESQSNNSSNIRIAQIAEALLDRLDRLVDVASDQLGVSNKILKSRS